MNFTKPFERHHYPNNLLPDELELLACLKRGEDCDFRKSEPAGQIDKLPVVRGGFIASLLRGEFSNLSLPKRGVKIFWGKFVGGIDLCGSTIDVPVHLENCYVDGELNLSFSKIKNLALTGTFVEKFNICEIEVTGSVILNYGFLTPNPVFGRGAKIAGQLGCSGGEFGGTPLAMSLEAAQIKEAFFWRQIVRLKGILDLTSASVGTLVDDRKSWPEAGKLRLAGFTYNSLAGNTNSSFYDRLEWLKRQFSEHLKEDFRPQPFEHLKTVLENSGREEEARKIAIQKLHFQRNANFSRKNPKLVDLRQQQKQSSNIFEAALLQSQIQEEMKLSLKSVYSLMGAGWAWFASFMFWLLAGYGYRPMRCLLWSMAIIIIGAACYHYQFVQGNISNLKGAEVVDAGVQFYPLIFAADTYIPFIDLGQSSHWVLKETSNQKLQLFLILHWVFIFLGWFFTAIFGASVTGLVRK